MAISIPLNPIKSFRFIDMVKTLAARNTVDKSNASPREISQKNYRDFKISPREISNNSTRSDFKVQSNMTYQDRFIDIFI